jgi:hypothetical protein
MVVFLAKGSLLHQGGPWGNNVQPCLLSLGISEYDATGKCGIFAREYWEERSHNRVFYKATSADRPGFTVSFEESAILEQPTSWGNNLRCPEPDSESRMTCYILRPPTHISPKRGLSGMGNVTAIYCHRGRPKSVDAPDRNGAACLVRIGLSGDRHTRQHCPDRTRTWCMLACQTRLQRPIGGSPGHTLVRLG